MREGNGHSFSSLAGSCRGREEVIDKKKGRKTPFCCKIQYYFPAGSYWHAACFKICLLLAISDKAFWPGDSVQGSVIVKGP